MEEPIPGFNMTGLRVDRERLRARSLDGGGS